MQYFSSTYAQAREKFLSAAQSADAELVAFENPVRGAEGERLFTDVALLGAASAPSVLVLCSGTHGVEGFCGSGIQTGLLRDGITDHLPDDIRIVMIHALNPYGFSHVRRVNEDNVDLNRNFIDHNGAHPQNRAYDALYEAINPRADSRLRRELAFLRLFLERAIKGKRTLKVAITEGQYTHPTGLFFGGTSETWSNRTLRTISDRFLAAAKRVAFVDIHTGLGPFGHGELICRFPPESAAYKRMAAWWAERVIPADDSKSASNSLTGTTTISVSAMLPESEVTSVTLEFGTVGPISVLRAMQAENWLYHHGGVSEAKANLIKSRMHQVYYPDTDEWKRRVWEQGQLITGRAIEGLANEGSQAQSMQMAGDSS
ncbi:MAG: M14 family metallopeptidase [Alphaproteobacteria bacterium]|nr:M14 family metallopeptidase [Alphaproteobacteria bacterium]